MGDRKVAQKEVDQLIEDASYLQKEAEALKYVIEDVPYDTAPHDGQSIAEILSLMDHAQHNYYHPIISNVINNKRPVRLDDIENYKDTFTFNKEDVDIQQILDVLAGHRASLVNELKDISLITWQKNAYENDIKVTLANIVKQMNRDDQINLKKITNLAKSYHQEVNNQREIKQRQARQNFGRKEE